MPRGGRGLAAAAIHSARGRAHQSHTVCTQYDCSNAGAAAQTKPEKCNVGCTCAALLMLVLLLAGRRAVMLLPPLLLLLLLLWLLLLLLLACVHHDACTWSSTIFQVFKSHIKNAAARSLRLHAHQINFNLSHGCEYMIASRCQPITHTACDERRVCRNGISGRATQRHQCLWPRGGTRSFY